MNEAKAFPHVVMRLYLPWACLSLGFHYWMYLSVKFRRTFGIEKSYLGLRHERES